VERREPVLSGKPFGSAGPYEKLIGKVEFALDPSTPANSKIVDLSLAPRSARGDVEFTADFYLLKPVDPSRGNGRLFYEVGNRGNKSILRTFQKAQASRDPSTAAEFGDGRLMTQGYALLWMGWQWDVPEGMMRMDMPIATDHGKPITGLVRGNFIPNTRSPIQPLADRGHRTYPVDNPASAEHVMTVRDRPPDPPQRIPREKWRFMNDSSVSLDGGFELGRIYDVVYRARDPRVVGCGLAGTRDLVSFLKYVRTEANPLRGIQFAYGWGVSQSGRLLRHFLYEGFNADEQGRMVFDGVIDEVGGAGRGSFNHRFAQASRDAEEFFNIFYPVDMFPFTDGPETDPVTGETAALLARAEARHVSPKIFHVLSNSEYFNRGGSLIHTDPTGQRDMEAPRNTRIYAVASGPHFSGVWPPAPADGTAAPLNPLDRSPIVRALLEALDRWVANGTEPPPSRYPKISDGTLTAPSAAGWPRIPGVRFPPPILITYRLDFGPEWSRGIVDFEPPHVGKPYAGLVPAVDRDGNARAGIRLPAVAVPLATYTGWNYRAPGIGAPDQFLGEAGSIFPFAPTVSQRSNGDSRLSIAERYAGRAEYLGRIATAARQLIADKFLLAEDLEDLIAQAATQYDWVVRDPSRSVTTLIGTGRPGFSDNQVNDPYGMEIGPDGALYFCDLDNQRIRRLDLATKRLTTVAGSGQKGYRGDGGPALDAALNMPHELRFDAKGDLYIAERDNHVVRKVDMRTRIISTVAGTGTPGFSGDGGSGTRAQLRQPHSIFFDRDGTLLICDIANHRIRRLDLATGTIETYAGTGEAAPTPEGAPVHGTPLKGPRTLAMAPNGDLYLALREGNAIYRIDARSQTLHRVAGTGELGYGGDGGPGLNARLGGPKGLSYDGLGNLYLADTENHAIRRIDLKTGIISTVLGTGQRGDGPETNPLTCRLSRPHGVLFANGVLFVADSEAHRIRELR
jgi:sugar lactone lactonase YvrE